MNDNVAYKIDGKPVFTVREHIKGRTDDEVFEISEALQIDPAPYMEKYADVEDDDERERLYNEWVREVVPVELPKKQTIHDILLQVSPTEYATFKRAAAVDALPVVAPNHREYRDLAYYGLISLFGCDGEYWYVVPTEIRDIYAELEREGFDAKQERHGLIRSYIMAATEIYGAITVDDLKDVINTQNADFDCTLNEIEIVEVKTSEWGTCAQLRDDILVNIRAHVPNDKEVADILSAAQKYKRYVPPKDTFLRYDYVLDDEIESVESKAVADFLRGLDIDLPYNTYAHEIYSLFQPGKRTVADFIGNGWRIWTQLTQEQKQEYVNLLAAAYNNTRMWRKNGNTPTETGEAVTEVRIPIQQKPSNKPVVKPAKIGRNDPCPCGSGKKYKHCCLLTGADASGDFETFIIDSV